MHGDSGINLESQEVRFSYPNPTLRLCVLKNNDRLSLGYRRLDSNLKAYLHSSIHSRGAYRVTAVNCSFCHGRS